jgi:hypothetical protein
MAAANELKAIQTNQSNRLAEQAVQQTLFGSQSGLARRL